MSACASCGAALEQREGPGRPSIYCSDGCRRMAEFRIRALVRRVDRHETQIRELVADDLGDYPHLDNDERKRLLKIVRRWLAEDQATLRALLGVTRAAPKSSGRSTQHRMQAQASPNRNNCTEAS